MQLYLAKSKRLLSARENDSNVAVPERVRPGGGDLS